MSDFKISGYGTTIKRLNGTPTLENNLIEFVNCRDVVVEGLTLHGDNEKHGAKEAQLHNFGLYGCTNITFISVKSMYSMCDGFHINRLVSSRLGVTVSEPVDSKNITLTNVISEYSSRQGLSVISVDGLSATNCKFSFTGSSSAGGVSPTAGVDLESNAMSPWQPKRVTFDNCEFSNNNGAGLLITSSNDFTIVRNAKIERNNSYGLMSSGRNVLLENANFDSNGLSGNARADLTVANSGRDGALSSIYVKNVKIKNAYYTAVQIEEGVRFVSENLEVEDCFNAGIRLVTGSGTAVYDWSTVQLKNTIVRRIYTNRSLTGGGYLGFVGNYRAPVYIEGMVIDKTNLDTNKTASERGFDSPSNLKLFKNVHINGDFSDFSARNIRSKAQESEENYLNGSYDQLLNYTEGSTWDRPSRPIKGRMYFDTTLNKPIICKTESVLDDNLAIVTPAVWIDATGAIV